MNRLIPVERETKRAEQRALKSAMADHVSLNVGQVQNSQHRQQQEEWRPSAREANPIEDSRTELAKISKALHGREGNKKAGDGEEDRDSIASIRQEQVVELRRENRPQGKVKKRKAERNMQQNDGQNRKSAQQVDSIEAARGWPPSNGHHPADPQFRTGSKISQAC